MPWRWICVCMCCSLAHGQAVIRVDPNRVLSEAALGSGVSLATGNGVFSQLLAGEAFAENVGVDVLGLAPADRARVYVVINELGDPVLGLLRPDLWDPADPNYDVTTKQVLAAAPLPGQPDEGWTLGSLVFKGPYLGAEALPEAQRISLFRCVLGPDQVSRFWTKVQFGSAEGAFELVRARPYTGRQSQGFRFSSGSGELGLANAGCHGNGIRVVKGRPYEGVLHVKVPTACKLHALLRSGTTGEILAQRTLNLRAKPDAYERVTFELIPEKWDTRGVFVLAMDQPGQVILGYAFLQPGPTARVGTYPLIKEAVEALKAAGPQWLRFNGFLGPRSPDRGRVRWKTMLDPIDERRVVYRSEVGPYSTLSFGLLEFLDLAAEVGAQAMVGLDAHETGQDVNDVLDYLRGPAESIWGHRRVKAGRPAPYRVGHIEIGCGERLDRAYVDRFKVLASAIWDHQAEVTVWVSVDLSGMPSEPDTSAAKDLARWVLGRGRGDRFGWVCVEDVAAGREPLACRFAQDLEGATPGHRPRICLVDRANYGPAMAGALSRALRWISLHSHADVLDAALVCGAFRPWGDPRTEPGAALCFNPVRVWRSPAAWVDELFSQAVPEKGVVTECNDPALTVLARKSAAGKAVTVWVVNPSNQDRTCRVVLSGFQVTAPVRGTCIRGPDPFAANTPDDPDAVTCKTFVYDRPDGTYPAPAFSVTRLQFNGP